MRRSGNDIGRSGNDMEKNGNEEEILFFILRGFCMGDFKKLFFGNRTSKNWGSGSQKLYISYISKF